MTDFSLHLPTISQLRAFVAVAEFGSFNAAADELYSSQPAISQQIKSLEKSVGVLLFDRARSGAVLTPEGELLLTAAQEVLTAAIALQQSASQLKSGFSQIRIAAIPTMAPYLLPIVIAAIQEINPELRISVSELRTNDMLQAVSAGQVDLGLLATPVVQAGLAQTRIAEDDFLIAVATSHRLARKKSLSLSDVVDEDVLLMEDGHCLRDQALEICALAGLSRHHDVKTAGLSTICQMVAAGQGVTLLPKSAAGIEAHKSRGVVAIPISDKSHPHREIGFIWRETAAHQSELRKLSEEIGLKIRPQLR